MKSKRERERGDSYEKREEAKMHREKQANLKDTEKRTGGAGWVGGGMCEKEIQLIYAYALLIKLKFIQGRIHNPSYFYS